jgi:hypothetical protein
VVRVPEFLGVLLVQLFGEGFVWVDLEGEGFGEGEDLRAVSDGSWRLGVVIIDEYLG